MTNNRGCIKLTLTLLQQITHYNVVANLNLLDITVHVPRKHLKATGSSC